MALPDTIITQGMEKGYNPPHKKTVTATAVYYFDASDAGPTDPNAVWTNDANGFDGSTATVATCPADDTDTANVLKATGTTAPTSSSDTITQVEVRVYSSGGGTSQSAAKVYDSDGGTSLGTCFGTVLTSADWGSWVTLSEPSGGWDWPTVAALHVEYYGDSSIAQDIDFGKCEIRVTTESSSEYYAIVGNPSGDDLHAYKSSDPGTTSWTEQDSAGNPALLGVSHACVASISDGTYIHVVTYSTDFILFYNRFDMSADTWDIIENTVADYSGEMDPPDSTILWCSIALRPGVTGDELVIAAAGLPDADMGTDYQRVDLWHGPDSGTPSWTGPVSIDASIAAANEAQPQLLADSSDGVHTVWSTDEVTPLVPPNALDTLKAKTIRTDNTLSTEVSTTNPNVGSSLLGISNLALESTALGVIATNPSPTIWRLSVSGGDVSEVGTTSGIVDSNNFYENGETRICSLTYDDVGDLHLLWSDSATQDLFRDVSTDDGSTWGTDTEELDAVTVNYISAASLDAGVVAYLYDDGTDTKYNEVSLSSAVVVDLTAPTFNFTAQDLTWTADWGADLTAATFNFTAQDLSFQQSTTQELTTATFSFTAQDLTYIPDYIAELTAASFGFTAQDLNFAADYILDLTSSSFNFTAQDLEFQQFVTQELTTATFSFSSQDLTYISDYIAQLTAASFNFTTQDLEYLANYLVELTTSSFNFTAQDLSFQQSITQELTAASFNFTAQDMSFSESITGSGSALATASQTNGTGELSRTGSGSAVADDATTSGEGEAFTVIDGSGSATSDDAETSGTGERVITEGVASATADDSQTSGTGIREIIGSGTSPGGESTTNGEGAIEGSITGSGVAVSQDASTDGTGEREVPSTGTAVADDSTTDGTGELSRTGSGAAVADDSVTDGIGSVGGEIIGDGGATADDSTTDGTGEREITGTGTTPAGNSATDGTGEREVTGTATIIAFPSESSGAGDRIITGTGTTPAGESTTVGLEEDALIYYTLAAFILDQPGLEGHVDDRFRDFLIAKGFTDDLHNYDLFDDYLASLGFNNRSLWDKYRAATIDGFLWTQGL